MYNPKAYSATSATAPFAADTIERRDLIETDVKLKFYSVAAILTSVWYEMNGVARSTRLFPVMRLSVE